MGIALTSLQVDKMMLYLEEMLRWNKAYNLTAIRNMDDMVSRHLLDSLAVLPHATGKKSLDIGSGAGLPGVPLAIMQADCEWVLLDSNGKKARFLRHIKRTLALDNLRVMEQRAEDPVADETFDQVSARAFASLDVLLDLAWRHLEKAGRVLAMKGREELEESPATGLDNRFRRVGVYPLDVPGLEAVRHLLVFEKR